MARICHRHAVSHVLARPISINSVPMKLAQQLAAPWRNRTRLLTERDARLADKDKELHWRQTRIDQRPRTGAAQALALWRQDGALASGTAPAVRGNDHYRSGGDGTELAQLSTPSAKPEAQAKRQPLPAHLPLHRDSPRTRLDHLCLWLPSYAALAEDVAEAGLHPRQRFTVERHIRGKWSMPVVRNPDQAPVGAGNRQGMPASGLLTQVLIGKYVSPLCRQGASSNGLELLPSRVRRWRNGSRGHCAALTAAAGECAETGNADLSCCMPMKRRWHCSIRIRQNRSRLPLGLQHRCPPSCQSRGL